jgi:hypothetical protein
MPPSSALPIAIYYEQPNWFKPLFAELDRRGTSYVKLHAPEHTFAPEQHPEQEYALIFNRMSPSAWNRDHGDQIFYTLGFLDHLERRGVRVINGLKASNASIIQRNSPPRLPNPPARPRASHSAWTRPPWCRNSSPRATRTSSVWRC